MSVMIYYILQSSSDCWNPSASAEGTVFAGQYVSDADFHSIHRQGLSGDFCLGICCFLWYQCSMQRDDTTDMWTQHFFLMQQYYQQYQWLSDAVTMMSLPFDARSKRLICLCVVFHTENIVIKWQPTCWGGYMLYKLSFSITWSVKTFTATDSHCWKKYSAAVQSWGSSFCS